jgi:hypothetical protein
MVGATLLTDELLKGEGFLLWRPLNGGLDGIGVRKMYGTNHRVQLFDVNGTYSNYCYHSKAAALEAF